jgi:hypothetical protein
MNDIIYLAVVESIKNRLKVNDTWINKFLQVSSSQTLLIQPRFY